MIEAAPLIVTLQLDAESFEFLNGLRTRHFPPERNFLKAHVTLFHHLPPQEIASVKATLRERAAGLSPIPLTSQGWRFLGRGVAASYSSPVLEKEHRALSAAFSPWLTPQDQQKIRPHVTVQNKTDPARARALFNELQSGIPPRSAWGKGFELWRYLNGPWEWLETVPFPTPENAE